MTGFIDVQTVEGPAGEMYVQVPAGHVLLLITQEMAEKHADWRECVAVRIVTNDDGTVGALEVTNDEDLGHVPGGLRCLIGIPT